MCKNTHRWGGAKNFLAWPTTLNLIQHNFFLILSWVHQELFQHLFVCLKKKKKKRRQVYQGLFLISLFFCMSQSNKKVKWSLLFADVLGGNRQLTDLLSKITVTIRNGRFEQDWSWTNLILKLAFYLPLRFRGLPYATDIPFASLPNAHPQPL